jgi:CheY-like chemotaxis protein
MKPYVLLVDDDRLVRERLIALLAPSFHIVGADNCAAALRTLASHTFDALILDLEMPGEDGRATYNTLTRIRPQLTDRTIILSAGTLKQDLEAWATGFGDKYIRKEDVFGVVARLEKIASEPLVE